MKDFKFTQQNIKKLINLNYSLRKEELRIKEQLFIVRAQLENLVSRNLIDDFNIDLKIAVFSEDEATNQKHKVEPGDPIYESIALTEVYFEGDDMFFENWNEYQFAENHPLASLNFCYSMHDILFHSPNLDWKDIFSISDVWLEMTVDYQFWLKKV